MVIGANRQLPRQSSQKLNDTVGSHADHNLSHLTAKPLHPVNQTALFHTTLRMQPTKQQSEDWRSKRSRIYKQLHPQLWKRFSSFQTKICQTRI